MQEDFEKGSRYTSGTDEKRWRVSLEKKIEGNVLISLEIVKDEIGVAEEEGIPDSIPRFPREILDFFMS